jgi:hypothetical protein
MGAAGRRALGLLLAVCLDTPTGMAQGPLAQDPLAQGVSSEAAAFGLSCGEALTVWRKARDPGARECCALLIRARAGLWTSPVRSLELAEKAQGLCPASLEAMVTVAASLLGQGRAAEADRAFERARSLSSALAWTELGAQDRLLAARAASLAGAPNRALEHYRPLILELDQIPSPHERARILLEGALLAARVAPPQQAEAQAYLRQSGDQLAPRLAVVRRLVARAIEPQPEAEGARSRQLGTDDADVVTWMQKAGGRGPIAAPGELLPAVPAELLRELLREPVREPLSEEAELGLPE